MWMYKLITAHSHKHKITNCTARAHRTPPDWAHETLLEHDAACRFFRYEMNDNNMGFGVFYAMFRVVVVVPDAAGGDAPGCELR
uniref:Uncharacterized protein n=1 Tax=Oryza meridionalis TaxID=40149 RepID=A0A0E0FB22_9ORYZ